MENKDKGVMKGEKETDYQTERQLDGHAESCRHLGPAVECPDSLFTASAPPLWATSEINVDHYRRHATQALPVAAEEGAALTPAPQTL